MTGYLVAGLIGAAVALAGVLAVSVNRRLRKLEEANKARLPYDKMESVEDLLALLNRLTWDKQAQAIRDQQELETIQMMWDKAAKVRES